MAYVGRFAPSPTGPLHIGSLTTAVASFLHARRHGGEWLVRIEDVDPPRELPGAADAILRTLERFDLHWDRSVLHQRSRFDHYHATADTLVRSGAAYACSCTRNDLREESSGAGVRYPGTCRTRAHHERATAVRVRVEPGVETFVDELQGTQALDLAAVTGDYVIVRRDGLPAYHLAVVLDDAEQGVTNVVRGNDLLPPTFAHRHLQRTLGLPSPAYCHLPVVVNAAGQKLSKQTKARPLDESEPDVAARQVLDYLGAPAPPELAGARPAELWAWAIERWTPAALRGRSALPECQ